MLPVDSKLEAEPLTVMTYNVYVGGSTDRLLAVENLLQVPQEVANMYNNVIASDFPGRAAAIAKSIKSISAASYRLTRDFIGSPTEPRR